MSQYMFITILLSIIANLHKTVDGVSKAEVVIPSNYSLTDTEKPIYSASIETKAVHVTERDVRINSKKTRINPSTRQRKETRKEEHVSFSIGRAHMNDRNALYMNRESESMARSLEITKDNNTLNISTCYQKCNCTMIFNRFIKVDCAALHLTHIPNFHSDVISINLRDNIIRAVPDSVSFPTHATFIDLSSNVIKWIGKGVFRKLSRLRYLDISFNRHLSIEVMPNVTLGLNESEIKTLKFNGIQCNYGTGITLKRRHLINLQNSTLEKFYCDHNAISKIENGVIKNLPPSIKLISVSNNKIVLWNLKELLMLPNIRSVYVSGMTTLLDTIIHFDFLCSKDEVISGRNGLLNHMFSSVREANFTFYFPDTLEVIDLRRSMSEFNDNFSRFFLVIPNLKIAHFEGNYLKELHHEGLYKNKTDAVFLSNNYCTFISPEHFMYAVNMRELYLDNNYLGDYLSNQKASSLFQNQEKLQILDLSGNQITTVTKDLFSKNSAMRHLNLAGNKLSEITFEIVHMTHLMMLNLSENRIRFLNSSNMRDLDRISDYHNVTIDLTGNELLCTCDTIDFLEWIRRHTISGSITFRNYNIYKCTYTNSSEIMLQDVVANIDTLTLHCSSNMGLIIGCVLGIVVFLSTVLLSVLYRYRWKIRYLYFTTKRAFSNAQPQNDTIYRYNIFLSYAEEDKDLALEVILPYLEKDGNTKVCCHTRDFTPGRTVADNIARAIHDSHFTLCVISGSYLKSYWCMYEFNLAKMESEYARGGLDVLLLILCKGIVPKSIPLNLMHHIESKSYLEVPDKDDMASTETFLERLKTSIS